MKQVGPTSFFALLVIGVSFLPVLALEAQEGRLFKPLAYTKNLAMIIAAFLAITLYPALRVTLTHIRTFDFRPVRLARASNALLGGKVHAEEKHPVSRFLMRAYEPVVAWSLRNGKLVVCGALALVLVTIPVYRQIGSEFMPPARRGCAALHADHQRRHLDLRGTEAPPGLGPHPEGFPGGGPGARQGRARQAP